MGVLLKLWYRHTSTKVETRFKNESWATSHISAKLRRPPIAIFRFVKAIVRRRESGI